MDMNTSCFDNGKLYINNSCIDVDMLQWNAHPTFKGVYLKHIIKGENTDGMLSCHLVKVDAGCEIGIHNHAGITELHEVIDGDGCCLLGNEVFDYRKGVVGFIPADENHLVKAGNDGLFLLAKFFPALL
jgi:Uncharacterized conserved protein, contains double-stranded beta-helix domain